MGVYFSDSWEEDDIHVAVTFMVASADAVDILVTEKGIRWKVSTFKPYKSAPLDSIVLKVSIFKSKKSTETALHTIVQIIEDR